MAWIGGSRVSVNLSPSTHQSFNSTVTNLLPSSQNPNSSNFLLHLPSFTFTTPIIFTAFALGFGLLLGRSGGNFLSKFYAWVTNAKQEEPHSWDPHALSANILLKLNKLSRFKKYKVSEVILFDENKNDSIGSDDPFYEKFSLRVGGIYTKAHLQRELKELSNCGMFQKADIECNTKTDGTIGIKLLFAENTWQISDGFRCINVGLLPGMEFRKDRQRPCLLPLSIHKEVLNMLGEGKVTGRMLEKIRNKVEKWYHDNGYVCAQVVNLGNLDTREIICEVVEGDITRVVLQFQDKFGNVCEENTQLAVVKSELLKHLGQGKVFNIEEAKQVLHKLNSLALFSTIDIIPCPDGKEEGGIAVEIILKELDQQC